MEDLEFRRKLQNRWLEIRQGILSDQAIANSISSIRTYLDESQERNFDKWPVLGSYVWPNYYVGPTYELVSVEDYGIQAMQVYPNPFTDFVSFRFSISYSGDFKISIFNLTGQLVWADLNENLVAGDHFVSWNGTDHKGQTVLPGVYLYTLSLEGKQIRTGKLVKY